MATVRHASTVRIPHTTQHETDNSAYSGVMPDASPVPLFAELISQGRRRKNWSQEDLETASGVSRSTISRWERGLADKPEPAHVRAVCAALGIDPRRAAIALGYLTEAEVAGTGVHLEPQIEEVLRMLEDPSVSATDKQAWIEYLKYLYQRGKGGNPFTEAAS